METNTSQPLLPESNSKSLQPLLLDYKAQAEESEGGLDLGQIVAAVRRRILIVVGVTAAVASVAVFQAKTSTTSYSAKFEILTRPVTVETELLSRLPDTLSQLEQSSARPQSDQTKLKVLLSPKVISPIVEQLQEKYPGISYDSLVKSISIEKLKEVDVLEVGYQDPDSLKVQAVLKLLAESYLNYSLEERQGDVRKGMRFVETQLPILEDRVSAIEDQLQRFRQQNNLLDPQIQSQQLSQQIGTIESQKVETQTKLSETRLLHINLRKQLDLQPNEAIAAAALSEAPRYQKLLDQVQDLDLKIATELARFREETPQIQALREQQRNLLPLLEQESKRILRDDRSSLTEKPQDLASQNSIRLGLTQQFIDAVNQEQALEARSQALDQAEGLLNLKIRQFPALTRQNSDLERQLKIATDNLNQFLTKREALRIDAAQKEVPWQLLTPPTEPVPSLPGVANNLVLGVVLGSLLGLGFALLVDKFSDAFYTPKEIKDTTGLLLLGEIPIGKQAREPAITASVVNLIRQAGSHLKLMPGDSEAQLYKDSYFLEAFRTLYTNICFLRSDVPIRSLVVSSAAPEDGKSTVALNLAQAAATLGQRVLLVDAALRHPQIHTMLGLSNEQGLSNVLASGMTLKQAPSEGNLLVLTAGLSPANPTQLLSSAEMRNLMEQFQTAFDLVIYDAPPLVGLPDSNLLAAHTDGILLVVRLSKTNRSLLAKALDGLKLSRVPVLGIAANGVNERATNLSDTHHRHYVQNIKKLSGYEKRSGAET